MLRAIFSEKNTYQSLLHKQRGKNKEVKYIVTLTLLPLLLIVSQVDTYDCLSIVFPIQFRPEDTAASRPSPKVQTRRLKVTQIRNV